MIAHRRNMIPGARYFHTAAPADRASALLIDRVADPRAVYRGVRLETRVSQKTLNPGYIYYYTRDKAGRITQKIETMGGVATTYDYLYDTPGRLRAVGRMRATRSAECERRKCCTPTHLAQSERAPCARTMESGDTRDEIYGNIPVR